MSERAMNKNVSTNLLISVGTSKSMDKLIAKPVLIWETKQKPDERADDNLLQMRRPAREEGRTGEATAMEWTIGTDEANGKEEASAAITMVSSGFGEAVQAPTAVQTSSSTPKMLAA